MSAVTIRSIDDRVDTVIYHRLRGTSVTVCEIRMVNGFVVIGHSACVKPEDFDAKLGEEIAYENAFQKLWELEGYLAAEDRYRKSINEGEE